MVWVRLIGLRNHERALLLSSLFSYSFHYVAKSMPWLDFSNPVQIHAIKRRVPFILLLIITDECFERKWDLSGINLNWVYRGWIWFNFTHSFDCFYFCRVIFVLRGKECVKRTLCAQWWSSKGRMSSNWLEYSR